MIRLLSEERLQSNLQSSDWVSPDKVLTFSLIEHLTLNISHGTLFHFFFQQHLYCVVLNSTHQQNNCQSNSVGDPVTKAEMSHERPTSCWLFVTAAATNVKAFTKRALAQYLLTSGTILSYRVSFVTVPRLKEAWENTCDFFFLLINAVCAYS